MAFYTIAVLVWLAGTFGWFGISQDPLSGVFLVLLGQPWTRFIDFLPQAAWPITTALAPALNAALIIIACKVIRRIALSAEATEQ